MYRQNWIMEKIGIKRSPLCWNPSNEIRLGKKFDLWTTKANYLVSVFTCEYLRVRGINVLPSEQGCNEEAVGRHGDHLGVYQTMRWRILLYLGQAILSSFRSLTVLTPNRKTRADHICYETRSVPDLKLGWFSWNDLNTRTKNRHCP